MTAQAFYATMTIQRRFVKGPRFGRADFVMFESRVVIAADFVKFTYIDVAILSKSTFIQ